MASYQSFSVVEKCLRETAAQVGFAPFGKGVYSKRKEFVPNGSQFFPLELIPFQKWIDIQESKHEVTKVVSLVKNGGIYRMYPFTLQYS